MRIDREAVSTSLNTSPKLAPRAPSPPIIHSSTQRFCTIRHISIGTMQLFMLQVYCICDGNGVKAGRCVTHLSLTHSLRLLSCRCHRHETLTFPLPRRVWLYVMGVATDTILFACFSSTAARMRLHHAAHCAHMVTTDKAASDSLPVFFYMHVRRGIITPVRLWLLNVSSDLNPNKTAHTVCFC